MFRQRQIQVGLLLICTAGCLSFRHAPGVPQSSKNAPVTVARSLPGVYAQGQGYGGRALTLNQDGNFAWEASDDTGFHQTTRGTYKVSKTTLILQPTHTEATQEGEDATKPEAIPLRYFCVPWGERLYLVETDQIQKFCEAVNVGSEPCVWHGKYLLRADDEGKEVKGKPQIPRPWSDFVLARPVMARVRAVTHTGRKQPDNRQPRGEIIAVTVDADTQQGLKPGMKLLLYNPVGTLREQTNSIRWAIIRRVGRRSALAEFELSVYDNRVSVKRGWKATTRWLDADSQFRKDLIEWKMVEQRRKKER